MILDFSFDFGTTAAPLTNAGETAADQVSVGIFDAGSAKFEFASRAGLWVHYDAVWTAAVGAQTFEVQLLGADLATLDSNPIVIASSGTLLTEEDGTVLTGTSDIQGSFLVPPQKVAKQFYGLRFKPTAATSYTMTCSGRVVNVAQTHQPGAQASVPAT